MDSRSVIIILLMSLWLQSLLSTIPMPISSSDGVLFYVHSLLLLASPIFSTMFTLPTDLHSQETHDDRPYVAASLFTAIVV